MKERLPKEVFKEVQRVRAQGGELSPATADVVPKMEALRKPVDELEMLVAKDMWPMPSYGDLLFEV